MQTLPRNINPFALMLDPQAVIAQIERSERLEGLHRRVCRPLDKPLLGSCAEEASDGDGPATTAASAGADAGADVDSGTGAESAMLDRCADGQFFEPKRHD